MDLIALGKKCIKASLKVLDKSSAKIVRFKGPTKNIQITADLEAEKAIIDILKKSGEDFLIISEEGEPVKLGKNPEIEVLDRILIERYVKIICSAENERFGKPHPGVYLTAANKLGVRPEDCLVFEDTINGLVAAKAARMKCVAVPNEFNKGDRRFCLADITNPSLKNFCLEHLKNL